MPLNLNIHGEMAHARALAENSGLVLQYEEDAVAPRTDGTNIYLPTPDITWSQDEWDLWRSFLYHEIGHNVPEMKDAMDYVKENGLDVETPFGFCLNVLEDYRQERFGYDKYEGKRRVMARGREIFAKRHRNSTLWTQPDGNLIGDMFRSLYIFDMDCRDDFMPNIRPYTLQALSVCPKKVVDYVKKLEKGGYKEKLNAVVTFQDELELLYDILENVYNVNPEDERKKSERKKNTKLSEAEESLHKKRKGKPLHADTTVNWSDLIMHRHDDSIKLITSYNKQHINYDKEITCGKYKPYTDEETLVVDYDKNKLIYKNANAYNLVEDDWFNCNTTEYKEINEACEGNGLSRKVARLLQIQSRDKHSYGKKKGKLHSKNLYRAGMKDAHGFNKRVFKQREINNCLDVSVTVLGDCSGSMGGTKFSNMGKSMVLLGRVLGDLNIKHELVGFTDSRLHTLYLYKKFSTNKVSSYDLSKRIQSSSQIMSQNADGDAILWCVNRILKENTKRKIIIVLSDGCPASWRSGSYTATQPDFLKMVTKNIEKSRDLEIYGIGIEDDNVKLFYKDYKVIHNSDQLEDALLSVIKTKIIG